MEVQYPLQTGCEVLSVTICHLFALDVDPFYTISDVEGPGQTAVVGFPALCDCRNEFTLWVSLEQTVYEVGQVFAVFLSLCVQDVEGFQLTANRYRQNQIGDSFVICFCVFLIVLLLVLLLVLLVVLLGVACGCVATLRFCVTAVVGVAAVAAAAAQCDHAGQQQCCQFGSFLLHGIVSLKINFSLTKLKMNFVLPQFIFYSFLFSLKAISIIAISP